MARTGRVNVDITADASGVRRGARDAEGALNRLKGVGKSAGVGLGIGVAAAVPLLFQAGEAASDLGEQVGKNSVVFKDQGDEVVEWSGKLATSLGLSQRAALEAAGTFGNMLVPMGVARDEAAKMSQRMVGLSADMASFNNADPTEVLDSIRAGLSGEAEPLRRFGVFLTAARVEQEAMNLGLAKGGQELSAAAKAQATYSLILKDTKDAQGDFARTSGSMANQQRIAKAEFENAAATVGQTFLPLMTKALQSVNGFIRWASANWPRFRQATAEAFEGARRAAQPVIEWIRTNVVPTIQAIVTNARALWARFGGNVKDTFAVILSVVRPALKTLRSIIETALALIRGDWDGVWKGLKGTVVNAFATLWAFLKGVPAQAARNVAAIGKAMGQSIANGMIDIVNAAIGRINSALRFTIPGPGPLPDVTVDAPDIPRLSRFARGGMLPGPIGQAIPIMAHGREAIVNPQQQNDVVDRRTGLTGAAGLAAIFGRTGGIMGGRAFAAGGFVNPFPGGSWAGSPAGHRARALGNWQSDNAWDIMGRAGDKVYAVLPGTITRITPSGSSPQFAGEGVYLATSDGQWWYRHIDSAVKPGQRVNAGDLIGSLVGWTQGGPHLHLASDRGDPGRSRSGAMPGRGRDGTTGNQTGAGERVAGGTNPPTPLQVLTRAMRGIGSDRPRADAARAIRIGAAGGSSGLPSGSLSEGDERRIRSVGRAAGATRGQEARDDAERVERMKIIGGSNGTGGYIGKATGHIARLKTQRGNLTAQLQKIGRSRVGTPASRRKAIASMRKAIAALNERIDTWKALRLAWQDEYAELGYAPAPVVDDGADGAGEGGGEGGAAGPGEAGGISADGQAQIDQANARAAGAERNAVGAAAWMRTLFGSGSIDPQSGAVSVTINTLHPGDPAIQGELATWIVGALGGQGSVPATRVSLAT